MIETTTKRNPYLVKRAFNSIFFAALLATASSNLAVIVDGIIVGQLLGADALAAVNLSMPIMQLYLTLTLLLGVGTSMLSAMAIGKGDKRSASGYFTFAMVLCVAISVVVSLVGLYFMDDIVGLLCTNNQLTPLVKRFSSITIGSAPIFFMLPILCTFLRIDGAAKLTAKAMIVANVVNIAFDIILITGFGMDIIGSSIATVIGYSVGVMMLISHFLGKRNTIKLQRYRLKELDLRQALLLGLPTALASALLTVKLMVTNSIVLDITGATGASYLAASMSLMMLVSLFCSGVSQTIQPIGAMLLGQRDNRGVRFTIWYGIRMLVIAIAAVVLIIEVFTSFVAEFYGISTDPAALSEATSAIRLVALSFLPFALNYLLIVVYQISKRSLLAISVSIIQPTMMVVLLLIARECAPEMIWWVFLVSEVLVFIFIYVTTLVKHHRDNTIEPLTLLKAGKELPSCDFSVDSSAKDSLGVAITELDSFFTQNSVGSKSSNTIRLIVEELVGNILKFAYPKSHKKHYIDIRVILNNDTINLSIKDDGMPFNPLLNKNINDGLGLKILQGITPEIDYKYLMNQNITSLSIKL
ncbi:MAG: MATE family efflux transporter [Rikenellaceae bacterium]